MDTMCPLLKGPCIEHGCRWFIEVKFTDQTGESKARWGCAIEWFPVLVVEQCKETRHVGAAVESARNESRKNAAAVASGLVVVAEAALRSPSDQRLDGAKLLAKGS